MGKSIICLNEGLEREYEELNPESHTRQAFALPLSQIPTLEFH